MMRRRLYFLAHLCHRCHRPVFLRWERACVVCHEELFARAVSLGYAAGKRLRREDDQ